MADFVQKLASNLSTRNPFGSEVTPSFQSSVLSSLWSYYLLPAVVAYPLLCSALRYRRSKSLQAHFKYGTREHPSYEGMTVQEAHEILDAVSNLEFPAMYTKGLQFALFRTYGISSISDLLYKTTQLSALKNVPKRYADTTVLLIDMYSTKPDSQRHKEAIGRLNYLHGHYINQGKISNDDMLYTLALFLNQPPEWINRYEWRKLTDLELCAMGVYHKHMGEAMQISFDPLPSSKTGWKDGLEFYHELDRWSKEYEEAHMVPDIKNFEVAKQTRAHLMSTAPAFLHPFLVKLVSAPIDDRLREAIMFEQAPSSYVAFLEAFTTLRKLFLRYLALPRPRFMEDKWVTDEPDKSGFRYFVQWDTKPIYVKPTLWNRWGPGALISRALGVPVPGDEGTYPEGFKIRHVGPSVFVGKGNREVDETIKRLETEVTVGCPFAVRRS